MKILITFSSYRIAVFLVGNTLSNKSNFYEKKVTNAHQIVYSRNARILSPSADYSTIFASEFSHNAIGRESLRMSRAVRKSADVTRGANRLVSLLPPVRRYILFFLDVHRAERESREPSHPLVRPSVTFNPSPPLVCAVFGYNASNGLSLHSALRHLPSRVIGSNGRARARHKNNNDSDIYRTY